MSSNLLFRFSDSWIGHLNKMQTKIAMVSNVYISQSYSKMKTFLKIRSFRVHLLHESDLYWQMFHFTDIRRFLITIQNMSKCQLACCKFKSHKYLVYDKRAVGNALCHLLFFHFFQI